MKPPQLVLCGSLSRWLLERAKSIGSSDAPAILGVAPFSDATPLGVYVAKTQPPLPEEESEAKRWGHLLEAAVAANFGGRSGLAVESPPPWSLYRSEEAGFLHATPDRFVVPEAGPRRILEVKTTRYGGRKLVDGTFQDEWESGPPLWVQVQVQHQLLVLGLDSAYVAVLIGGQEYRSFEVHADRAFQSALLEKLAEFWARVQARNPPEHSGHADYDTVRRMFTRSAGRVIALSEKAVAAAAVWAEARRTRIALEKVEKDRAATLMAELGDAEIGLLPDGTGIKWANEVRKEKAREARETVVRVLRPIKDTKGLTDGGTVERIADGSGPAQDADAALPAGIEQGAVRGGPAPALEARAADPHRADELPQEPGAAGV
jgi:putative phage-type endonuclease